VRKRGLYLTLAHQRFGQIDENMIDAILTNCHIKAVFGGLPVPTARRMAEELFINELDPLRIKVAIYQTKFWPTYERDTVYTRGSARGAFRGTGDQWGNSDGSAVAAGVFYQPDDRFGQAWNPGTSSMTSFQSADSRSGSSQQGESTSEVESEADIPIMMPVPFKELSSVQHYTSEEQLTELTGALKEQFRRHCFIKIHQQKTQPMLVPFVEDFYTSRKNLDWYEQKLLREAKALPIAEVDRQIQEREAALLAASSQEPPTDFHE